MSKVFPDFQTFLDTRDGDTIGVTKVTMTSGYDYVLLPKSSDARILAASYGASLPNFYLNAAATRFSIDGNAAEKYTIVSRHRGSLNYNTEES